MKKSAFTMIELVFVIVILGILAAVAVPKFTATRTDAEIAKLRSELASIRSAIINERQSRMMSGDFSYIAELDSTVGDETDGQSLYGDIMDYPIYSKQSGWVKKAAATAGFEGTYIANKSNLNVVFNYESSDGTFDCDHTDTDCQTLAE